MLKFSTFLVALVMLLASPVQAGQSTVTTNKIGKAAQVVVLTSSIATSGLDTCRVAVADAEYIFSGVFAAADTTAADLYYLLPVAFAFEGQTSSAGGAASTDSFQVAIDVSYDGDNWTQVAALAPASTGMTNAAPNYETTLKFHSNQAKGLKTKPVWARLRSKNLGAGTGKGRIVFTYPIE